MNILKQKDNYIIVEDNGLSGNYLIDGNILTDKGSDDVHIVNSEKDTVIESNNDGDNDTVSSLVSYVLGEHIENLTLEDVIKQEDGMLIYGNPKDNRWVLDTHQGDNGILKIINPKEYTSIDNETHYVSLDNINLRFYGTCGISSILNLLIVAGKIKNEEDRYQSTDNLIVGEIDKRETAILREVILNFDNEINISSNIEKSLGGIPEQGIYSLPNHSAILNHFNVGHYIIHNSSNFLERIGSAIKDGYGVIINVDSNVLWGKTNVATLANHDVFIVGVSYEKNTNNIKSFYIMDTGDDPLNLSLKEITFEKMKTIVTVSTSALITNEKIKNTDNNLNGTGNQLDNIIKGNQGLNILKGEAGDDVLIGNEGQDTLYGGADDDVLIAGIAKKTNESGEKEDLTNQELKNLVLTSNSEVKINSDNFESENEDENYLSGDTGKDLLIGDKGEDLLRGGDNDDILIGGKGFDRLFGENNNDVLIAGKVTESINLNSIYANKANIEDNINEYYTFATVQEASAASTKNFYSNKSINNNLYGGLGNDLLIGDIGHDILVAGSGEDYLYGGAGRDVLCNYANSSFLNGGYGDDRYDLKTGTTNTINDTDNKGTVHLNQYWVRGAEALFYLGSNVWHKDNITYTWNEDAKILTIQKDGDAGITTIENYENGALCITLEKPWSNPINADGIQSDPLIFDLNGNGIKTSLSPHQGIYYDYNNDGFAEKLSWSAYGDGVLVADTNNDGKIQGSGDILTSLTLASYDTNFDGKIDYQDEYFNNLKIMDEEYNLYSLEEAGISSINLDYQNVNFIEGNGNECKKIATYTKTNGQELQYGEYLVQTNPQNAIELNKLEETEAVSALPDIDNSGTVYSLHQAMLRDNELQTLVTSFTTETNDNVRMNLLEQIILKWTGAEDVEINSRGSHINAQHLAAIEAFDGIDFYSEYDAQYGEEGTNPSNPNKVRRLVRRLDFNLTELIEREERKVA